MTPRINFKILARFGHSFCSFVDAFGEICLPDFLKLLQRFVSCEIFAPTKMSPRSPGGSDREPKVTQQMQTNTTSAFQEGSEQNVHTKLNLGSPSLQTPSPFPLSPFSFLLLPSPFSLPVSPSPPSPSLPHTPVPKRGGGVGRSTLDLYIYIYISATAL